MARTIDIRIQTTADLAGAKAVDAAIARIIQATKQAGGASKGGDPFAPMAASAQKAATASQNLATAQQRTVTATNQAATAAQRLATEQQRTAAAASSAAAAQSRAEQAALRLAQAQNQAGKGAAVLPRTLAGLSHEAASAMRGMLGLAAAVEVFNSFAAAFKFKAELDATTASINAQLKGVRDTSEVYAQAAAFGREFKLTQQETTSAIAASIGVMRTSKASVEDILGVLARMQVLSPEQSLQEAAIALKALASGDTTSLVTRFEVGRDVANEMKAEIQGGADAVQVMSAFLSDTGIGMDTLKAKTEGAAGALKDAAIAAEDLKLAQAAFAEGPGLVILEGQTRTLQGATRALTGDTEAMAASLQQVGDTSSFATEGIGNYGARLGALFSSADQANAAQQGLATAMASAAAAAQQAAAANIPLTSSMIAEIDAAIEANTVFQAQTVELTNAANASLLDSAAKQEQAAVTALVTAEAQAAADAFIALHPNISASGAASAAAAGGMSPLIARLIEATLRANEARNALAMFNAMAGIKATGGRMADARREDMADIQAQKHDAATAARQRSTAATTAAAAAERRLQSIQGNEIPTIQHLRNEAAALAKTRGTGSADYINKLADIAQAETRAASAAKKGGGGGGGGGGASPRVSAAEATGGKLADIARTSGAKLAEIEESTQQKLAAIDQKYADIRARAMQALNDEIARMSAGGAVDQQLNDFDQFQKNITEEQQAAFEAREEAEVRYNERIAAAQAQAREEAAGGDADLASEKLKIREAEAKRQMEIEQRAAQANVDTGGAQAAAVAQQAAEASKAAAAAAATDIAIAEAKAAEKAGAQQAEKEAVIASAEEQAAKVIGAAEDQAAKVKGAADSQKSAVISALRAQADAASSWADSVEASARRAQSAMGSVTGPTTTTSGEAGGDTGETGEAPSAGGGQGIAANGRRGIRSVSAGTSDVLTTLAQAVGYLMQILPLIKQQNEFLKHVRTYQHTMQETIKVFADITALHRALAEPLPPISPTVFADLADEINEMMRVLATKIDPQLAKSKRLFEHILGADTAAVAVFTEILKLRAALSVPSQPIMLSHVQALADEAVAIVAILRGKITVANQKQTDELTRYQQMASASIQIIQEVAELGKTLAEPQPAIPAGSIRRLADLAAQTLRVIQATLIPVAEAQGAGVEHYASAASSAVSLLMEIGDLGETLTKVQPAIPAGSIKRLAELAAQVVRVISAVMVPLTEEAAAGISRYADVAQGAVGLLMDAAKLPVTLAEPQPAIPVGSIKKLAELAAQVVRVIQSALVPLSEEEAAGLERYASAAGASIGIISDVAGLGKDMTDLAGPIAEKDIIRLANDAKRITRIMLAQMLPATEEQADAARRFAETEGAAIEALKSVLGLPAKMFLDYQSPSDAQIGMVVKDANRIVRQVDLAARAYSTKGLEAAKAFGEATGGILTAFKDQLIFAQTLSSGDFKVDPKNLATFELGMSQTLAVASRLGAQAAAIPAGNIAALQGTVAALNASYDSMIKLASVPFGNIPQLAAQLGGGSGGSTVNNITINTLAGQNANQIADVVIQRLNQRVGARRS